MNALLAYGYQDKLLEYVPKSNIVDTWYDDMDKRYYALDDSGNIYFCTEQIFGGTILGEFKYGNWEFLVGNQLLLSKYDGREEIKVKRHLKLLQDNKNFESEISELKKDVELLKSQLAHVLAYKELFESNENTK